MQATELKQLTISNEIRNDSTLFPLVDRATELLIAQFGRFADTVEVCWTLETDALSQRIVSLNLTDWSGSVFADFSEAQLANERQLGRRFVQLWGDLLQIRSDKQLEKLHAVVQTLTDD